MRDVVEVYPGSGDTQAFYDKATGIFLGYRLSIARLGGLTVSLKSTNIFESFNVADGLKSALDLVLVAPLFALPLVGAVISLSSIRSRGVGFSPRFWWGFILLNGALIAHLSNWSIPIPGFVGLTAYLLFSTANVVAWMGMIGAAISIAHCVAFPIITKT